MFISLIRKIVGDPITKEYTDRIKDNLDDLDQRINQVETTGGSVFILNSAFRLAGLDFSDPYIFYYKATQDFSITEFRGQIKEKGLSTTGNLALDLQVSRQANPSVFNSVLNSNLKFDYAAVSAYEEDTAPLNNTQATISAGDILRIEVISTPINFGGDVILSIGGE